MNHRQLHPRLTAPARFLVILGQPLVAGEPSQRPFDDPALRQDDEPGGVGRALDDLQDPAGQGGGPGDQRARVALVGPDPLQARKDALQLSEHQLRPVAILNARTVDDHHQQQAQRVYGDMPLAALDLLAGVVTIAPPFCGVRTDWLSMIAAEGVASRPAATRTFTRKASCTVAMIPPSRHRRKWSQTSSQGGKSWGR